MPLISGKPCILISAFVNDCHWIAITRREIDERVYFLYNDDMNNPNTEADIKSFLQHKTDQAFYPTTAGAHTIFCTPTNVVLASY